MSIFFTGHRPPGLGGYDTPQYKDVHCALHDFLVNTIISWANPENGGHHTYITGMAQGFDQIAANAVCQVKQVNTMGIRLIAAIPYPSQADWWRGNAPTQYLNLLQWCDAICVVNQDPIKGQRGDAAKKLDKRNHFMVSYPNVHPSVHANEVFRKKYPQIAHLVVDSIDDTDKSVAGIACTSNATKGGTANCIRYANSKGISVLAVNPFNVGEFSWR